MMQVDRLFVGRPAFFILDLIADFVQTIRSW